jgi:arylsulfatase A-like enzyme
MQRIARVAAALALILAFAGGCRQGDSTAPPLCPGCNVVLITVDTLRADHLGAHGYVRNTSPRIDELARASVLFEHAVVAWPKTVPGLGSVLTGNYGHTIRMMYATFDPLREESTTVTELLKQAGYATGGFTTNGNLLIKQGWSQGFDEYQELWKSEGRGKPSNVAEHARRFLDARQGAKFFLWLHYIDPHGPYVPGEREFRGRFINDSHYDQIFYDKDRKRTLPIDKTPPHTWRTFGINGIPGTIAEGDRTEVAYYIAEYDAEIAYTDKYVGAVVDDLKARGLWEKTVLVFTADHGEALGGHDWYFDHGRFAYDDVSRIPLLVYVPGVAPRVVRQPVSSNDIAPTILELVGEPPHVPMDGSSLVPILTGKRERVADYVFNEAGYNRDYERTVRDDKWKLIYVPSAEARSVMQGSLFELYDIEQDPLETMNRAADRPDVVDRLKGVLFQWMEARMPPLDGFELTDGTCRIYTADFDFRDVAVEGTRFYARVRSSPRDDDYCFTLPVPDPDARIVIELLEGSAAARPFATGDQRWDDPKLTTPCVGDPWGCLKVNGAMVGRLPFEVRLGDLTDRVEPAHASLRGQGNDKTFCFHTAQFNKRQEKSEVGYVIEVMGVVERGKVGGYDQLDEATRKNLEELGYVQ